MKSKTLHICISCGRNFNAKVLTHCPVCRTPVSQPVANSQSTPGLQPAHIPDSSNAPSDIQKSGKSVTADHPGWSAEKKFYASQGIKLSNVVEGNAQYFRGIGVAAVILIAIGNISLVQAFVDNLFVASIVGAVLTGVFGFSIVAVANFARLIVAYIRFKMTP
jgi:hypothetical protein